MVSSVLEECNLRLFASFFFLRNQNQCLFNTVCEKKKNTFNLHKYVSIA